VWIVTGWRWQSRPAGRIDRRLRLVVAMVRLINTIGLIKRIKFLIVGLQVGMTKTQISRGVCNELYSIYVHYTLQVLLFTSRLELNVVKYKSH